MSTYSVAQIKDFTSVPAVANWSDDKILLKQATAEAILDSYDLDTTNTNYSKLYPVAVMELFDMIAENPTGLKAQSSGKTAKTFDPGSLPMTCQNLIESCSVAKTLRGAKITRSDIGLR